MNSTIRNFFLPSSTLSSSSPLQDDDHDVDLIISSHCSSPVTYSTPTQFMHMDDEEELSSFKLPKPDFTSYDTLLPSFQTLSVTSSRSPSTSTSPSTSPSPSPSTYTSPKLFPRINKCPPAPSKLTRPRALHVHVNSTYQPRTYELLWNHMHTSLSSRAHTPDPTIHKRLRDIETSTHQYEMSMYTIDSVLHQGNHIIWKVYDRGGQVMAIKRSYNILPEAATRQYVRHIRSFAELYVEGEENHVLKYHAVWSEMGYMYTLMDYIPHTLTSYLASNPITDHILLRIVNDITSALHRMEEHALQLSHRRPEYIRTRTRGVDHPSLTLEPQHILVKNDGICLITAGDYRVDAGHPHYMAPFITSTSTSTPIQHLLSTALYSFGFILYEILTNDMYITHGIRHQFLRSTPPDASIWICCYPCYTEFPSFIASLMTMDTMIQPNLHTCIKHIRTWELKLEMNVHTIYASKSDKLIPQVSPSSPIPLMITPSMVSSVQPLSSSKRFKFDVSFQTPPPSPHQQQHHGTISSLPSDWLRSMSSSPTIPSRILNFTRGAIQSSHAPSISLRPRAKTPHRKLKCATLFTPSPIEIESNV